MKEELFNTGDEIIEWQLKNVDKMAEAYAEYQKNSDLKKTIYAMCKLKYEGTNAFQETQAENDPEYKKFLEEDKFKSDLNWKTMEGNWKVSEGKLGWIRSKLKYAEESNNNTL